MVICKACATRIALMTACLLTTGIVPGKAKSNGITFVFGKDPKRTGAVENILLLVFISTWISNPITASKFIIFPSV